MLLRLGSRTGVSYARDAAFHTEFELSAQDHAAEPPDAL